MSGLLPRGFIASISLRMIDKSNEIDIDRRQTMVNPIYARDWTAALDIILG
jgi:hypothetical protein